MERLSSTAEPVITIDLLRGVSAIPLKHHAASAERVISMVPHASSSVLVGDRDRHRFEMIIVSEYSCGATAHASLMNMPPTALDASSSHATLFATVSPAFASLPTLKAGDVPPPLSASLSGRQASDVPFLAEGNAHEESWAALLSDPEQSMLAFNLLRTPDPEAYKAYSAHFSPLPERYGMRFVVAGALDPDPAHSVLRGAVDPEVASNDLLALVYFPSSGGFLDAWSDPDLVHDAYPLRTAMLPNGFRHIWLRCHEAC